MGTLNQYGYVTTTYAEKRTALEAVFKTAFGDTLVTAPQTPQGNIIDYITTFQDNEDKVGLAIFQQLNYRNASGTLLSAIAISKGQPRKNGTRAVITCTFTSAAQPYTIAAGSIFVSTTDNYSFTNETDISISNLSQSAQLIAVEQGATGLVSTDTLSAQAYFSSLTNIAITAIQDGTNKESDNDLIDRLTAADTELATNDVDAIYDKLNRLADTTRVAVYQNATASVVNGVPAYGIEANVVGGLDADIATIIFDTKASGTPTSGGVSNTVYDSQGYPQLVNFNRPTMIDIWVRVRITSREGAPIIGNIAAMSQSTLQYINSLRIGIDVSRTPIFGIFGVGGFDISEISLSYDGSIWVETNLAIGLREYAFMANVNQVIVENV
jgi:hypothetical protein